MKIEKEIITNTERITLENGTVINRFTHIREGAEIGENSMIGQNCYVASTAKIGNNVRIQNGNYIWDGVQMGDECFIAPCVHLTNCNDPSLRIIRIGDFKPERTIIGDRVTICTAAIVIAPIMIGDDVKIGAGSIILRNLSNNEFVKGIVK